MSDEALTPDDLHRLAQRFVAAGWASTAQVNNDTLAVAWTDQGAQKIAALGDLYAELGGRWRDREIITLARCLAAWTELPIEGPES